MLGGQKMTDALVTLKTKDKGISETTPLVNIIKSYPDALEILTKNGFFQQTLEDVRKAIKLSDTDFESVLSELKDLTQPVRVTPGAVKKVLEIMKEEGKTGHGLRVRAVPGGMGGIQYDFAFEKKAEKGDLTLEYGELKVFLDQMSLNVMEGSKIDFLDGPEGSGFKVDNPNAKAMSSSGGGGGGGCGSGGGGGGCCG